MIRLLCLFLCVGVSVEELERNFMNVNLERQNGLAVAASLPPQIDRKFLHLIPEGRPSVKVTQSDVIGRVGTNVTLECFMDSSTLATNFWMLGSERIYENNTKYRINEVKVPIFQYRYRFRLYILSLDNENYLASFRCFSHNKFGDAFGIINMESYPPLVTTGNNTIEGVFGNSVTLECTIDAVPLASAYWVNSTGAQIMDNRKFSIFNEDPNSFRYKTHLQIINLEIQDFSKYKCVARSKRGEHHQIINLIRRPSVKVTQSDVIGRVGTNVTLECFMDSSTLATNFWMLGSGRPSVKVTQSDVIGRVGTNVTLECFMDSSTLATNFWMLGSEARNVLKASKSAVRTCDDSCRKQNGYFIMTILFSVFIIS